MNRRARTLCTLALSSALLATAGLSTAAASELVQFSDGLTSGGKPTGIARGTDGNLWVTEAAGRGAIARVTPSGSITEFTDGLTADAAPTGIAPGSDGNVWFTESARAAVGRITPAGDITEFTLGVSSGSEPQDIVGGADGNLWFTQRAGTIGRITPTGVVTEFASGMPEGARPQGITAGPDGSLWFTDASDAARIGRITTDGVITTFDALPSGSLPYDITTGADGNLWFTLSAIDRVGRMTPAGDVTLFDGLRSGAEPLNIALGPDGQVWLTERHGGRLTSVDTSGVVDEHPASLTFRDAPTGVTPGPGGSVWFTAAGEAGAVGAFLGIGDADSVAGLPLPAPVVDPGDDTPPVTGDDTPPVTGDDTPPVTGDDTPPVTGDDTPPVTGDDTPPVTGDDTPPVTGDDTPPVTGDDTPADTPADQPAGDDTATPDQPAQPSGDGADSGTSGGETAAAVTDKIEAIAEAPVQNWSMPVQGETLLVVPVAEGVRVRSPGAIRSNELTEPTNIPIGSRIDTRTGALALVTELPGHKFQMAYFKDGRFDVKQNAKGNGIVDLFLRGKTGCGGNGEPDPLLAAASSRKAKASGRRLWAADNKGRFRTHGRDSVATVRGTEWITEDTCDGTKTTVVKGAVEVRDLHTGEKTVVKAGRSYLARTR